MHIITQKVPYSETTVNYDPIVNRVFVVDCSGSMWNDINYVRTQMSEKIPRLTRVGDTVSIIRFSSKGCFDTIYEGFKTNNANDIIKLRESLKSLKADGCTGFVEPINLSSSIAIKLKKEISESVAHLFFMTDGYDNCWSKNDIISSIKSAGEIFEGMTIVEYGWNCNRMLLTEMASEVGATQVFCENFNSYDAAFENNLICGVHGNVKKTKLQLETKPARDYISFRNEEGDVITAIVQNDSDSKYGYVMIPEGVSLINYPSESNSTVMTEELGYMTAAYSGALHMDPDTVFACLTNLQSKCLIDLFCNSFTKQDYSDFCNTLLVETKEWSKNPNYNFKKRLWENGQPVPANYLPKDDAYTVLDFLDELTNSGENLFYPYHKSFQYEKMSIYTINKTENLKFVVENKEMGYPISDLTFNENRANVSVKIRIPGKVIVDPTTPFAKELPKEISTYIFRNYNVIKDGIKHSSLKNFPVSLSKDTFDKFVTEGLIAQNINWVEGKVYNINVNLPVINRKSVTSVSAKSFYEDNVRLTELKSYQKVYNSILKASKTTTDSIFSMKFGVEATKWLEENGLNASCFSAPTFTGLATDSYPATEINVKIAKFSSIPTINDKFTTKISSNGKLTPSETLCAVAYKQYLSFIMDPDTKAAQDQVLDPWEITNVWVNSKLKEVIKELQSLRLSIAKTKMSILLGHIWFSEFSSMEESELTIVKDEIPFVCTTEIRTVSVEI